jgi:hypothetical protein
LAHVLPGKSGIEQVTSGKQTGLLNVPPDKTGSEQTASEKLSITRFLLGLGLLLTRSQKIYCHNRKTGLSQVLVLNGLP